MKRSNILGFVFTLLIGVLLGGWLTYKYKPLPNGMVMTTQASLDSLDAYIEIADSLEVLANMGPDTVYVDSIVIQEVPVYIETTPTPIDEDDSLTTYVDSLHVEGEINAWVQYKVRGYVEGNMKWGYTPITHKIETIIEKPVPYPVIKTVNVPKYITGNYVSLAAGGNNKMFIFGLDYDLVKQNYIYGLQYRRYGENNVYGVKLGINLNSLFNKRKNGP